MKRAVVITVIALSLVTVIGIPASGSGVTPCVKAQVETYWVSGCSPVAVNGMYCLTFTRHHSPYVFVDVCVPTELPPP